MLRQTHTAVLAAAIFLLTGVVPLSAERPPSQLRLPYRFLLVVLDQWGDPGSFVIEDANEFRVVASLLKTWGLPFDILRLDQQNLDLYHLLDRDGRPRYGTIIWDARLGEDREEEIETLVHLVEKNGVSLVILGDALATSQVGRIAGVEYVSGYILPSNLKCSSDHFITRTLCNRAEEFLDDQDYLPGDKAVVSSAMTVAARGGIPFLTVRSLQSGAHVVWLDAHRSSQQIEKPLIRALFKRSLVWAQGYLLYQECKRAALLEMHDMGASDRSYLPYWHYPTLTEEEIRSEIIKPLREHNAVLMQLVNTGFVDRKTKRIANPWVQAAIQDELDPTLIHDYTSAKEGLDAGLQEGVFEIHSHGWTHMLPDLDSPPGPFWTAPMDGVGTLDWYNEFSDRLREEEVPAIIQRFHLSRSIEYIERDFGVTPLFFRPGGGAYSTSPTNHTGRVAAQSGFGLGRLRSPVYLGHDLIIELGPVVRHMSWAYDEELKGADVAWSVDGPVFIYFHDRDVSMDGQALERLLTDLGSDVHYMSASEYCGYLHARVRETQKPDEILELSVHYGDHYGRYFDSHPSTWVLHLSDEFSQSVEATVPEKQVITLSPGVGDHSIRLKKDGRVVTD